LAESPTGNHPGVLRKVLWLGLYAGLSAAATLVARKTASQLWRAATGEQPPVHK
jgi:hypothetical protein